ncbi:MAG: aminomethyl transferase family protein [Planctomycetes bacterium]|nr:aminomethyl transferase family protein [Planctomycetota bacterium]
MIYQSPIRKLLEAYQGPDVGPDASSAKAAHRPGAATGERTSGLIAEFFTYSSTEAVEKTHQVSCELVGSFGDLHAEYAAIRTGAGIFDSPHRGTIQVTGPERKDFLNRMLTQELKDFSSGQARESFWLNRKGRIDADLLLMELGDHILLDVDITQLEQAIETLNQFIILEDVKLEDATEKYHHIAIHGKQAIAVIASASGDTQFTLENLQTKTISINSIEVIIVRRDQTGEIGLELIVPRDDAATVYEALIAEDNKSNKRVRPIGWFAFNTARIEAGTPLFNVDFAASNLPHETGVVNNRVSFTKGCYLGQEIVARIQSLGKPKRMLVGLRIKGDALPDAGAQVYKSDDEDSTIGVVTSSTISPMLGSAPIAFAHIAIVQAEVGNTVIVEAESDKVAATVCDLMFYKGSAEQKQIDMQTSNQTPTGESKA